MVKNKKKGFTLIELLAVIVVLAIIALIAVPIINGINIKVKKASFKESANGILNMTHLDRSDHGIETYNKYIIENQTVKRDETEEELDVENEGTITGTGYVAYTDDGLSAVNYTNGEWCATKSFDDKVVKIVNGDCSDTDYLKCETPVIEEEPSNDIWAQYKMITISKDPNKYCKTVYSINGGEFKDYSEELKIDKNNTVIEAKALNVLNNEEKILKQIVKIDETGPTTATFTASATTKSITITASGSDDENRIVRYAFSKDNGATWTEWQESNKYTFDELTTGTYQIKIKVFNETYGTEGATEELGAKESDAQAITTQPLGGCSITLDKSGWAQSKVATITKTGTELGQLQYKVISSASGASQVTGWTNIDSGKTMTINWVATETKSTYIYCQVTDGVNTTDATNGSKTHTETHVDPSAPTVAKSGQGTVTSKSIEVTASGTDAESGITRYAFSKDNGSTWTSWQTGNTYTFNNLTYGTNGVYNTKVKVYNGTYGSTGATDASGVKISDTKQITLVRIPTPTYSINNSGWTNGNKSVTINYKDSSDTYIHEYSKNGGEWTPYTGAITFEENGNIVARSRDGIDENTVTASSYSITGIDKTSPTVSYNVAGGTYTMYNENKTVTITGSDTNFSYMKVNVYKNGTKVSEKSDNSITSTTYSVTLDSDGTWVVETLVYDEAGNTSNGGNWYSQTYTISILTCTVGASCGSCSAGYSGSKTYNSSCTCVNNCSYKCTPGASCGSCSSGYSGSKTYDSSCTCVDNCYYDYAKNSCYASGSYSGALTVANCPWYLTVSCTTPAGGILSSSVSKTGSSCSGLDNTNCTCYYSATLYAAR